MHTTTKLQLLAIAGLMVICQPTIAAPKDANKVATNKHCPSELTNKQISELAEKQKATFNNVEFLVSPKFAQFAGKRYMELQQAGKATDTIALKNEKVKGKKAVCVYAYTYKAVSKKPEAAGKEVDHTGRIRLHTMLASEAPAAAAEKE